MPPVTNGLPPDKKPSKHRHHSGINDTGRQNNPQNIAAMTSQNRKWEKGKWSVTPLDKNTTSISKEKHNIDRPNKFTPEKTRGGYQLDGQEEEPPTGDEISQTEKGTTNRPNRGHTGEGDKSREKTSRTRWTPQSTFNITTPVTRRSHTTGNPPTKQGGTEWTVVTSTVRDHKHQNTPPERPPPPEINSLETATTRKTWNKKIVYVTTHHTLGQGFPAD